MKKTYTKKDVEKFVKQERDKVRAKHARSKFMSKSLSIYKSQQKRLRETINRKNAKLPYTVEQFRKAMDKAVDKPCCYGCGSKVTINKLACDHKDSIAHGGGWGLDNLAFPCRSCNWQKGVMSVKEFQRLLKFLKKKLSSESAIDVKRRLSAGGKLLKRN